MKLVVQIQAMNWLQEMMRCIFPRSPGRRTSRRWEDIRGERLVPQTVPVWQWRPEPPVWVRPGLAATGDGENRRRGGKQQQETWLKNALCCFTFIIICRQTQTLGTATNVPECDNCSADVQLQAGQVTQLLHSCRKGVNAAWQRLFLKFPWQLTTVDSSTQLAPQFRSWEPVRLGEKESFSLASS